MMELVGLVLPPIIRIAISKITDSDIRFVISFLICMIIGLGINFWDHSGFGNQDSIVTSVLTVWGASQISYNVLKTRAKKLQP